MASGERETTPRPARSAWAAAAPSLLLVLTLAGAGACGGAAPPPAGEPGAGGVVGSSMDGSGDGTVGGTAEGSGGPAAANGSTTAGPSPGTTAPGAAAGTTPGAGAGGAAATGGAPAPVGSGGNGMSPPGAPPVEMKGPIPTAATADLAALGIDVKNLPPIEKLEPRALRGVMKILARSLGARCGDCHVEGDFGAPTPQKKIAARMWDEFAAKLTLTGGSPIFCDSCHQGRRKLLDRTDKKALGAWMKASFVDAVARKDAQPPACEMCHVNWDMTFLSKWAQ